jgi:hypothetical protein
LNTAYQGLLGTAQNVSQTPFAPYVGQSVAPFTPEQNLAMSNINQNAGFASPWIWGAGNMAAGAAQPLTGQQIGYYMDPYLNTVAGSTLNWLNQLNANQAQNLYGTAGAQGALGGDRVGLAQAALAGQQAYGEAPTIANLYNTGWEQAVAQAGQQFQQNPEAVAAMLANFGLSGQTAGLQGAGAQYNIGQGLQQTQQAQDVFNVQQYYMQQGYPFQVAQWLAQIETGLGGVAGGSSYGTTTGPAPSGLAQGAGALGALLGGTGLLFSGLQGKPTTPQRDGGAVKGYQTGGSPSPYGGMPTAYDPSQAYYASMGLGGPYSGMSRSYVPLYQGSRGGMGLPSMKAAPSPAQFAQEVSGGQGGGGLGDMSSLMKGMGQFGKGLGAGSAGSAGVGAPLDLLAGTGEIGDAAGALGVGDMAAMGAGDLTASDAAMLFLLAQSGGRINYPGGLSLPTNDRIKLPMRGGLGMPSFVRGVPAKGYQAGGDSTFDSSNFESADVEAMRQHALDVQAYNLSPTSDVVESFNASRPPDWSPLNYTPAAASQQTLTGDETVPVAAEQRARAAALRLPPEITAGTSHPGVGGPPYALAMVPAGLENGPGGDYGPPGGYQPSTQTDGYSRPPWWPAPMQRPQTTPGSQPGFLGLSPDAYASIMAFGLSALANATPGVPAGAALGRAGLEGMKTYFGLKGGEASVEMESRKLDQQAQQEADRIRMEGERINIQRQTQEREAKIPHVLGERITYNDQGYPIRSDHVYGYWDEGKKAYVDTAGNIVDVNKLNNPAPDVRTQQPPSATSVAPPISGPTSPAVTYGGYQGGGDVWSKPQGSISDVSPAGPGSSITDQPDVEGPSDERPYRSLSATMATELAARRKGLHGQAYLDAVPEDLRNQVESTMNYQTPMGDFPTNPRMDPKTGIRVPARSEMSRMVLQANPGYQENYYPVIQRAYQAFFIPGNAQSPAQQSLRYNTAVGHAGELAQALWDLHKANPGILQAARESGTPMLSYLAAQAQQRGVRGTPAGEAINKVLTIAPAFAHEATTFYTPTGGTEESRRAFSSPFDPNLSLPEQLGALRTAAHMFKSKTDPLEQDYKDALQGPGLAQFGTHHEDVKQWINTKQHAQESLDRIEQLYQQSHPQDAISWARANPMDPRAATILKAMGVQ